VSRYIAMDIGCIECGEPSGIVGVFDDEVEATAACNLATEKQAEDWHGQHHFEVFDIEDGADYSPFAEVSNVE
jgi:hypothetical protein